MGHYQKNQQQADSEQDHLRDNSVKTPQPDATTEAPLQTPTLINQPTVDTQASSLMHPHIQTGMLHQMFKQGTINNSHASQVAQTVQRKKQSNPDRPSLPQLKILRAEDFLSEPGDEAIPEITPDSSPANRLASPPGDGVAQRQQDDESTTEDIALDEAALPETILSEMQSNGDGGLPDDAPDSSEADDATIEEDAAQVAEMAVDSMLTDGDDSQSDDLPDASETDDETIQRQEIPGTTTAEDAVPDEATLAEAPPDEMPSNGDEGPLDNTVEPAQDADSDVGVQQIATPENLPPEVLAQVMQAQTAPTPPEPRPPVDSPGGPGSVTIPELPKTESTPNMEPDPARVANLVAEGMAELDMDNLLGGDNSIKDALSIDEDLFSDPTTNLADLQAKANPDGAGADMPDLSSLIPAAPPQPNFTDVTQVVQTRSKTSYKDKNTKNFQKPRATSGTGISVDTSAIDDALNAALAQIKNTPKFNAVELQNAVKTEKTNLAEHVKQKMGTLHQNAEQFGLQKYEGNAAPTLTSSSQLSSQFATKYEDAVNNIQAASNNETTRLYDIAKNALDRQLPEVLKAGGDEADRIYERNAPLIQEAATKAVEPMAAKLRADPDQGYTGGEIAADIFANIFTLGIFGLAGGTANEGDLGIRKAEAAEGAAKEVADAYDKAAQDSTAQTKRDVIGLEGIETTPLGSEAQAAKNQATADSQGKVAEWSMKAVLTSAINNERQAQLTNMDIYITEVINAIGARAVLLQNTAQQLYEASCEMLSAVEAEAKEQLDGFATYVKSNADGAQTVFKERLEYEAESSKAQLENIAIAGQAVAQENAGADEDEAAPLNDYLTDIQTLIDTQVQNVANGITQGSTEVIAAFGTNNPKEIIEQFSQPYYNLIDNAAPALAEQLNTIRAEIDTGLGESAGLVGDVSIFGDAMEKACLDIMATAMVQLPRVVNDHLDGQLRDLAREARDKSLEEAQKAADNTRNRWQDVLAKIFKVVVSIIVGAIIAAVAIAITAATGGIGGVLLAGLAGLAIGAAGGLVTAVGNAIILGKFDNLGEEIGKEMLVGAITGLVSGVTAGGLTAVFGPSSSALRAGQMVAKESIDIGLGAFGDALGEIAKQGIFGGTINWAEVGATFGLSLGAGGLARIGTRGLDVASRLKPAPTKGSARFNAAAEQVDLTPGPSRTPSSSISHPGSRAKNIVGSNTHADAQFAGTGSRLGLYRPQTLAKWNEAFMKKFKEETAKRINPKEGFQTLQWGGKTAEKGLRRKFVRLLADNEWVEKFVVKGPIKDTLKTGNPFASYQGKPHETSTDPSVSSGNGGVAGMNLPGGQAPNTPGGGSSPDAAPGEQTNFDKYYTPNTYEVKHIFQIPNSQGRETDMLVIERFPLEPGGKWGDLETVVTVDLSKYIEPRLSERKVHKVQHPKTGVYVEVEQIIAYNLQTQKREVIAEILVMPNEQRFFVPAPSQGTPNNKEYGGKYATPSAGLAGKYLNQNSPEFKRRDT